MLLPFLATYALFLIYPFFRGLWISLHDWNLMAVAFNPDAKEFVGLRNCERAMWGRGITWAAFISPTLQVLGLLGIGLTIFLRRMDRIGKVTAVALGIAAVLLFVLPGFPPGEGGGAGMTAGSAQQPCGIAGTRAEGQGCHRTGLSGRGFCAVSHRGAAGAGADVAAGCEYF
ncbi:hypothetical protein [Yoonia sp.]|uniref:hypothetical protein n=1 Tax=Yoonia sp. TaxID=2212373 RepID=UPI0025EB790D|nr:hypothetical protein [Yoonia sp.]